MTLRHKLALILFMFFFWGGFAQSEPQSESLINFNHLKHLTETIQLSGQECDIVHIYAEYPDYDWVDAHQEGIACVDDVARAAVVYLRYFELYGDTTVLPGAQRLLNFVQYMQADDGEFYNFIDANHEINRTGRTSEKAFKFWAARGYWALATGYRIFRERDAQFSRKLKDAFLKIHGPLAKILAAYGQFELSNSIQYPQWLIQNTGADATSELLLGIAGFLKVESDSLLEQAAIKLAEGIIAMQMPTNGRFPAAFLSWKNLWHAWGNAQSQALAELGLVLHRDDFIKAAIREVINYHLRTMLLGDGLLSDWEVGLEMKAKRFPQIAYDIRCMTLGALNIEKTMDEAEDSGHFDFGQVIGLMASWLLGNNVAETVMYDPATGRCFDGINDSSSVNFNSGAESTIEALYTLVEVANYPAARKYLTWRTLKELPNDQESDAGFRIQQNAQEKYLKGFVNPITGDEIYYFLNQSTNQIICQNIKGRNHTD